ncbi:alpha/beta hydrolase [Novosphingobium resinovorum]
MLLPGHAPAREVDDSYTIGQRFAKYRDKFPGIAWPAVTWKAGQSVLFDRPYKNTGTRDLHIDVFRPSAGANRQGILLVHGGGWRAGAKTHFYALANLLAQRGYTVFLPEFRLSVEAAYPAGMIDIGDALAWTRAHAAEFDVDPSRIAVGGASSGGQMASLLAYAGPSGLFGSGTERTAAALIDLDGVLDFTTRRRCSSRMPPGGIARRALARRFLRARRRTLEGSERRQPCRRTVTADADRQQRHPALHRRQGHGARLLEHHGIAHRFFAFENAPHDFWLFEPWLPRVAEQIDGFLKTLQPTRGSAPE